MADFVSDTFTDTNGTLLQAHTGEVGATWTVHPSYSRDFTIVSNRCVVNSASNGGYYASGTPASADYTVTSVMRCLDTGVIQIGVTGRMDTSANTFYHARYVSASGVWELAKFVAGSVTSLGTSSASISVGVSYTLTLSMVGSAIKLLVDSSELISVTDTAITAAGFAGVRGNTQESLVFDSITATDVGAPAGQPTASRRRGSTEPTGAGRFGRGW